MVALDAVTDETFIYSSTNPVDPVALAIKNSPTANPLTLEHDITCLPLPSILPDKCSDPDAIVVAFATIRAPPTADTFSFSNTVVDNVPRIVAFAKLASPSEPILHP